MSNRARRKTWVIHPDAKREGSAKTPSEDAAGVVRLRDPGLGIAEGESFTLGTGEPPSIMQEPECESEASSAASEEWTSDSLEQDSATPSSQSQTPTEGESSSDTGRESRSTRTFVRSHVRNETEDADHWREDETALTVAAEPLNGLAGHTLISSAEDSPARTSASPAEDEDSQATAPASSSSSHESQTLFSPMEAGSSLRTYPDFFPPTVDEISPSYSRRWPSSGFTTSPGECWTADTSECPSDGAASSSLPDVLEDEVHPRFYLSPRAAAGILRRAEKRGRELPQALQAALQELSTAGDGATTPTRRTESSPELLRPSGEREPEDRPATKRKTSCPYCAPDEKCAVCLGITSPTPSPVKDSTPQRTGQGAVRRLSPTECERLQSLPDGWTIPTGPTLAPMDPATQPAETP